LQNFGQYFPVNMFIELILLYITVSKFILNINKTLLVLVDIFKNHHYEKNN